MPALGGFEVVGELTVATLNQILKGAWDNNTIPHSVDIAPGTAFGPYQLADGVVDIARDTLHLEMDVPINGVHITLPSEVQVEVANPPIPSARFFALSADIAARVPIGVLPNSIHVAAMLASIPRSSVTATVTSGNPIPPITTAAVAEYVHARYADGTIPHTFSQTGVALGGFSADAFISLYDDATHPTHQIAVSQPDPNHVEIRIPFHLKLSNMSMGLSPCGVVGKLVITSDFVEAPGTVTAPLSTAAVTLADYAAAPASDALGSYDSEGTNYTTDNSFSGGFLETTVKAQLTSRGTAVAQAIGNIVVAVPQLSQIETFIADQAHAAITGRGDIPLWTPAPPEGGGVSVSDVKPLALADAIAFCLNNPAGNTGAIVDFIPNARSCAIAIDGAKVIALILEQINKPESEGGFGGLPHTFQNVDGHTARLTSLDASLRDGSIHLEGNVTVVDAIADSIDVDASFEAEVGLRWVDTADGGQMLEPFVISSDVDLSLLAWILSFLLGFITFGLVGGIIAVVVVAVAEGVAETVGGSIIRDEVTGQVKSIGAWPQQLEGIGTVTARFENPVVIDTQSVMFPDAYLVTATYASVTDALARSNGPYVVPEGAEVSFQGGPVRPNTTYAWEFGDGAAANARVATHRYADDGLYVAKLTTVVHEEGGVTTRHFAAVRVANVAPSVDAGPALTVDEGTVVRVVANFTDPGWLDTHTALFDFGDNSAPVVGDVQETHSEPMGEGTASASHAWCDNGEYVVTIQIIDNNGGVGVATLPVRVRNVAPTIDAGDDMFAYRCTPITLVAKFTDPGWCDTHTGTWDFGDCTPLVQATVRERHEPPAGRGIVAATHRYESCGKFLATSTVLDDDGASASDTLVVHVVDVVNGTFGGGFRSLGVGVVANGWRPYVLTPQGAENGARFDAEEFVVHGGQRSQRLTVESGGAGAGARHAGLSQRIGTNVGWDYQLIAWFHAAEGSGARYRLGVDPTGGEDSLASTVVWSEGTNDREWTSRTVRVTAVARRLTIFLDAAAGSERARPAIVWFDDVSLLPYPCPLGDVPPTEKPPDPGQSVCVDWKGEGKPRVLGMSYAAQGMTFTTTSNEPLRVVVWGPPPNAGKLALPRKSLVVELPFPTQRVTATVAAGTTVPIVMRGANAYGAAAGVATSSGVNGAVDVLEIGSDGITRVEIAGGGGEGLLVELCIAGGVGTSDLTSQSHSKGAHHGER